MALIQFLFASLLLIVFSSTMCTRKHEKGEIQFNYKRLSKIELDESLIPVRQGIPGQTPFWNENAKRFIYVPAFDFKRIKEAVNYRFAATASDRKEYSFTSQNPWDNLAPIWLDLPVGYIDLEIVGLNKDGKNIGQAGTRKFYKAAPFNGSYNRKATDYKESYTRALKYIFDRNYIQSWKTTGVPDTLSYKLYCYPAKIMGAVIESMLLYSQLSETDEADALTIAEKVANYLIEISEPENSPLEFFPPTYMGNGASAKDYKDQFMVIYPAELAQNYLDLYNQTKKQNYYDAAIRIANTYKKLQLPCGTWNLKLWKDGTPVKENLCIPVVIIELLERLRTEYAILDYQEVEIRAFTWIMENPVQTFDWSGQFEDINPSTPYKNLTKHDACSFAIYLFKHATEIPNNIKLAEELVRFSEDQFVVWEKPMPHQYSRAQRWILPCALEQYEYYVPIDASVSKLLNTYLSANKATGKEIYMAKAIEFANAITVAQVEETGKYPTYWEWNDKRLDNEGWLNCASSDVKAMMNIQNHITENHF